jgi:meiotically up-regulated gene 157 (Mug157) protein
MAALIGDDGLRRMFLRCFPNTLETTVVLGDGDEPDAHVITGDIPAMWLRDSSAQVWPYVRLAREDDRLTRVLRGLIARQGRCIRLDPYANAFLYDEREASEWAGDMTEMRPGVHERKFEVDSLCYPVRLVHGFWRATGDACVFDDAWLQAMRRILEVFRIEQDHAGRSAYRFERPGGGPLDTLGNGGRGTPVARTGMVWSGFRPSDDRCEFHYLVPSQAFAVVSLAQMAEMFDAQGHTADAAQARALRDEIDAGIRAHAILSHPRWGRIYAYEVDGLGSVNLMDDANVPSLLSLPYLGYCRPDDPVYMATRRFVLSEDNPYFLRGRFGQGVGSPHTPAGRVWPMSIAMRALTTDDEDEIVLCLRWLTALHGGTYLMHESVDPENPRLFTRAWFAWANSLFAEMVLDVADRFPRLLQRFRA